MTTPPDDPRADEGPWRVNVIAGRAVNDPEKTVLPALIFASKCDDRGVAYSLSLGWWDWHVTVLWARALTAARSHGGM